MALAYITTLCKTIYEDRFNNLMEWKPIIIRIGYLIIVVVAVLMDEILNNTGIIRMLVIYTFILNEWFSIMENWIEMELPIPIFLVELLEQLKKSLGRYKDRLRAYKSEENHNKIDTNTINKK